MNTKCHLSNQHNTFHIKKSLATFPLLNTRPIKMNITLLNNDSYSVFRILHLKRKAIESHLIKASLTNNSFEIEYWTTIRNTVKIVLGKLKETKTLDELLTAISFLEMDCLVGIVEEYLHESYLNEMQLVKDDTPIITKSLQGFYSTLIPIYEENRAEFERKRENGS